MYLTLRGDFFMYAAHTKDGLLIYASEAVQTDDGLTNWFCPNCHRPVSLKYSHKGKAFFSHKGPCHSQPFGEDRFRKESESHLSAKEILAETLTKAGYEVSIEYYFEVIQQTADLFIYDSHMEQTTYIIEFQRSPISGKELQKRHKSYLTVVSHCLWLMDHETFHGRKIQTWHKTMLRYSKENGFHWFSLDVAKRQIVVKYQVPLIYLATDYALFEIKFGLDNLGEQNLDLIDTKLSMDARHYRAKKTTTKRLAHYQRRLQQLRNQTTYQDAIHLLYTEGCLLQSLPYWMITESWQFLVAKTPGWLLFAWSYCLILQFDQVAASFTTSDMEQAIVRLIKQGAIELLLMPFVEIDVSCFLTAAILDKLAEKEVITQLQGNEWRLVKQN